VRARDSFRTTAEALPTYYPPKYWTIMYSEARGWDARDMPFGGALPWPPSPKFTGMPNCEVTPEEKALQSANPALARRLGVTSTVRADADAYWQTK